MHLQTWASFHVAQGVMSLPDVHWWLADVMELADAKGPEVAQRCTLARLPLLASQAQLFKPPSSPGAADVAVARGFLGAYLKQSRPLPL